MARSLTLAPLILTLGLSLAPMGLAATAASLGFRYPDPLQMGDIEIIRLTIITLLAVSVVAVVRHNPLLFRIWTFVLIGLCVANLWGCGMIVDDLRTIH